MKKVLWIGDALCDSGFARATENIARSLDHRTGGPFEVSILGINYLGDPHPHFAPDVYPCWPGGDMFGIGRLEKIVPLVRPDVIVIQNDPWNIPEYMEILKYAERIPVVGILSINGKNCQSGNAKAEDIKERGLNALAHCIFWNEFARTEAIDGGYEGPSSVIPLGVDLNVYRPVDKDEARKQCGLPLLPKGAFLVGNVNRNQPRKHFDLTISYFAEWAYQYGHQENAYLFLHTAPTGERSLDIKQWICYLDRQWPGTKERIMISEMKAREGLTEETLSLLYNCLDVLVNNSDGEGMGLPALEAMASRVATVLPDWAAYGDWARGASRLVTCSTELSSLSGTNVLGALTDKDDFIAALEEMHDPTLRAQIAEAGYARATEPRFRWENIGERYVEVLSAILQPKLIEVSA